MKTIMISQESAAGSSPSQNFPLDQWYVAGFSSELQYKPIGRTFLNQKVVLYRAGDGKAAALEDRCCHKSLPLSCGTVEHGGIRCGYHGLLYGADGVCVEIPGQARIPPIAKVRAYHVAEKNHLIWIWMPKVAGGLPNMEVPTYAHHDNPMYQWGSGMYHYDAPWQLIHDNLLDLSHLGYVHLKTIGGDARLHMNTPTKVTADERRVKVVRYMPGSTPPPTYKAAWPFGDTCDRWQEIEFEPSHLSIWTGAIEPGRASMDDPGRGGLHLRGFHGITPETETSCHYFWSMASNRHPDMPETIGKVLQQIEFTFDEDRGVIEDQYKNMLEFGERATWMDIHCDAGANRARRILKKLVEQNSEAVAA
ncbi:Rieske 2Fe-2S domain-containing protein [Variovorax sp. HJSM1_2]|uniref:Rieske 2Fe-2S domain-containing protein n=1 Tax=Variovorax sp. HJSM1_2 TaxID=3366263 RepID=UPI003BCEB9DE